MEFYVEVKTTAEIEQQVNEIVGYYKNHYGRLHDYKNTFIPLSFFLETKIKNEVMILNPEEFDMLRQFRKLTSEEQTMFIDMFKTINRISGNNYRREPSIGEYRKCNNKNCYSNRHFYGYCYIGADSNWNNHYKIGRTLDPTCKSRLGRSVNPNYKILYRTKDCYSDSAVIEHEIHNLLKDKRANIDGYYEWFELSAEELKTLIRKYDFVEMETLLTSSN